MRLSLVALAALAGCRTTRMDFREVIRRTGEEVFPSLVYVRVVRENLSGAKNEKQVVSGSGVVITAEGEVLTNHHVIDKATEIRCLLAGGAT